MSARGVGAGIAVAAALVVAQTIACGRGPEPGPRFSPTRRLHTARAAAHEGHDLRMFVDHGSAGEARAYARYIEATIGFPADGSLDDLLKFCGYPALTSRELERLTPSELMQKIPTGLLAARFFAPQIVDVSSVGGPASSKDLGWRKLVALDVIAGSPAATKNLSTMYLLFNVFQPRAESAQDPYEPCKTNSARCSAHNQVILVPREIQPGADAIFWLVFLNAGSGGVRSDHLTATFDGGDHASASGGNPVKSYFLPVACAQCHGGSAAEGKLIYLDSDHWFDRTQPGDDFADLSTSPNSVVFDGGKDPAVPRFAAAMEMLTALNRRIRDQNLAAGGEDFGLRAVDQWLAIHPASAGFADRIARALPPPSVDSDARQWQDTPDDRRLLQQLNRYCFRCHSSIAYHVFDKEAVFLRRNRMAQLIERGPLRPGGMPQDRSLEPDVVDDLVARLRAMR